VTYISYTLENESGGNVALRGVAFSLMYLPIRPAFREGYPHTELDDEIGWPRSCMFL